VPPSPVITIIIAVMMASPIVMIMFTIMRDVDLVVPPILNEINGPATSTVLTAVPIPVFDMAWWNAEIDGWIPRSHPLHDYRFRID
jgi:hypothetical protein